MLPPKYILAVRSEERSDGNGLSMGQILWCLRFVAGDRNSDHGNLSGGGAPVSGCVFADRVRLHLPAQIGRRDSMKIVVLKSPRMLSGLLRKIFGMKE